MKTMQRPTLSLGNKELVVPGNDRPVELGIYDVLLPCRQFSISYKVAEVGRVSITTEFLLRLLKSADGMKEADVASFFGYERREMSFVMSEIETNGFVGRTDGRIYLTAASQGLFRSGSEYPEIFEVENRRETVGFDLIALAPEERRSLDVFECRLPELPVSDAEKVSVAADLIKKTAFRRFYREIVSRRDPTATLKRSLYSVDDVEAKSRFSSMVRISLQSTGPRPSAAEPEMSGWRPEHERDDRGDIIEAASRFIDDLEVHRRPDDGDAYRILSDLAPDFLKDFMRRDGLSVERYYRESFARAGDIRSDRPTVPLLGSLFTRENTRRLFEVAEYGSRSVEERPTLCIWFAPQTPYWGATTALPEILGQIKSRTLAALDADTQDGSNKTIGIMAGRISKHIETAFDVVCTSSDPRIPPRLEMLVVPHVLTAVTVNAPIGTQSGIPVPLGFASFDKQVVARAHDFLLGRIRDYALPAGLDDEIRSVISIRRSIA